MHPVLFQWESFTFYSYGFFVALALIAVLILLRKRAPAFGFTSASCQDLLFFVFLCGIIGARLFYVIQHWDAYQGEFWKVFSLPEGGLVWYGGLFFGAGGGLVFAWLKRWPILKLCDLFAPIIPLAEAIGRIGCFFNGCCYGKMTSSGGIQLPNENFSRIPIQLYWAAALFVFSMILFWVSRQRHRTGNLFLFYLAGYSLMRFFVEYGRGDQLELLQLSLPQWTSLLLFISVFLLLLIRRWHEKD